MLGTPGCKFCTDYIHPHICYNSGSYDSVFAKDAFQHGDSLPRKRFYDCETLDSPLVFMDGRGDSRRNLAIEVRSNPRSSTHTCSNFSTVSSSALIEQART